MAIQIIYFIATTLIASKFWNRLEKWNTHNLKNKFITISLMLLTLVGLWLGVSDTFKRNKLNKINQTVFELPIISTNNLVCVQGILACTADYDSDFFHLAGLDSTSLSIRTINGKLILKAVLHNKNGDVVAVLDGYKAHICSDQYDYNYDNDGCEITTFDNRVFFQLDYKNDTVWISGLFLDPKGDGYFIPNRNVPQNGRIIGVNSGDNFIIPINEILPIFKHRRSENNNLGSREKTNIKLRDPTISIDF